MPEPPKILTVSEINAIVKGVIEETFYPMWLGGEVGNLTIHRSGHVYMTLKDRRCQIKAVYFSGANTARELGLREGMEVEVYGRLSVYEARGNYQFNVNRIRPKGVGDLQRQFEELKKKLAAEGLFEEARKKPLPFLPRCVGVVCSPDGAALRDFLQIIGRRFAEMHVRIYPAAAQGRGAAAEIAEGIRFLNATNACDVIVVTRGGGSLEDLWAYNEELLARAVAASGIPVVSAVGHEVDFTICDFVADLRVPTPSAAAELVVGRKAELAEQLEGWQRRLENHLRLELSRLRNRVERAANHYIFREPMNLVRRHQQYVDELQPRMVRSLLRTLEQQKATLGRLKAQLRLLNPTNILARGYSIVLTEPGGKAVMAHDQVAAGDGVRALLAHGELQLTVTGTKPPEPDDADAPESE